MDKNIDRRDFLKKIFGGLAVVSIDWDAFPKAFSGHASENEYDVIIIGSGLGGLSCAAAFVRRGFKPLVVEQHYKAGGYATTFNRPGGFEFDVSLHSTPVGERAGLHNLIPGFPEIREVLFEPHPSLYRMIYPGYDISVPQKNVKAYISKLTGLFPDETEGIIGIFEDMEGITREIMKYSSVRGNIDLNSFPSEYPYLFKSINKTWGDLVDQRIKNPKLKAIVSSLWSYFGLPPSKLSPFYYAMPAWSYLNSGGYYPRGKSQKISNAFKSFIENNGGKILLNTKADKIIVKNNTAYGIRTADGSEFKSKAVISNANVFDTINKMIDDKTLIRDYSEKLQKYSVSLSCFQIFLGLKENLTEKLGIKDSEIMFNTSFDIEDDYKRMLNADVNDSGYGITLYDNIYPGYSPEGKNTVNIILLQGYDHWDKYKKDYFSYDKKEYNAEKKRLAGIIIKKVEDTLMPGLANAIQVMEISTPLTNMRYTGNYRGAIYGFDQTIYNSGQSRIGHSTPINNLYLAGAWTSPGHGYGGVIYSGIECFADVMKKWS